MLRGKVFIYFFKKSDCHLLLKSQKIWLHWMPSSMAIAVAEQSPSSWTLPASLSYLLLEGLWWVNGGHRIVASPLLKSWSPWSMLAFTFDFHRPVRQFRWNMWLPSSRLCSVLSDPPGNPAQPHLLEEEKPSCPSQAQHQAANQLGAAAWTGPGKNNRKAAQSAHRFLIKNTLWLF